MKKKNRIRITLAKRAFRKIKNMLPNQTLPLTIRKKVLRCYIELTLLYASEIWSINKQKEE